MKELKHWILTKYNRVMGEVYYHPDFNDGEIITTSPIKSIVNNVIITRSGSEYKLKDSYTHSLKDVEKAVNKITIEEYQAFTPTTFLVPPENALNYLYAGLAAEGGEVAGVWAKYNRKDFDYGELLSRTSKELGDVFYFAFQLANILGLNVSDILTENRAKLQKRLDENKIKGDGDNR